jgi:hypothetical protein
MSKSIAIENGELQLGPMYKLHLSDGRTIDYFINQQIIRWRRGVGLAEYVAITKLGGVKPKLS